MPEEKSDSFWPDFVLVRSAQVACEDASYQTAFESAAKNEGIELETEQIDDLIFVKLRGSFALFAKQAEKLHIKLPLKNYPRLEDTRGCCSAFKKLFKTDDEIDYVGAPFENENLNLFKGFESPETFFRSSLRCFLLHQILINIDIRPFLTDAQAKDSLENSSTSRQKGILHLLCEDIYKDSFAVHVPKSNQILFSKLKCCIGSEELEENPRESLKVWTRFWKFQPLWRIRNYFGEKIAIYFAWLGSYITLLWLPALAGLAIFIYGLEISSRKNLLFQSACSGQVPSSKANATTGLVDVVGLRNASATGVTITSSKCSTLTTIRVITHSILALVKDAFDNIATPFFSVVMCVWGALLIKLWMRHRARLAYEWDVDNWRDVELDRPEFWGTKFENILGESEPIFPTGRKLFRRIVSAAIVVLAICAVIGSVIAVTLLKISLRNHFNCPKNNDTATESTEYDVPTCVAATTVVPSFMNAISMMILGKIYSWVAAKLTDWENHRTQSDYNDALIIKLFAFQFANSYTSLFYIAFFWPVAHNFQKNGLFGLGENFQDSCSDDACMGLLSFQVLVLMLTKPLPKLISDVILPFLHGLWRKFKRCSGCRGGRVKDITASRVRSALSARSAGSKSDQPMDVPLVALLEHEFLKASTKDFTLTEYMEKIIQHGYVIMFSASIPLAPFLAIIINSFDIRLDAKRLLWWNRRPVPELASDIGMWQPIMFFITFCGVVSNGFIIGYTSGFCTEYFGPAPTAEQRLFVIVIFEHTALLLMLIVFAAIPSSPSEIAFATRKERIRVDKYFEMNGIFERERKISLQPQPATENEAIVSPRHRVIADAINAAERSSPVHLANRTLTSSIVGPVIRSMPAAPLEPLFVSS